MPEAKPTAASPTPSGASRKCTVQLLDDAAIQVEFKKNDLGSAILDHVCDYLNLAERDYFGLRYMDQNLHRYWLDPAKPILKQVKNSDLIVFAFRVKFYPADPTILREDFTRYLLVLQLRRDLLHGRLHCPQNDLAVLAAHIIQAELGDYNSVEHTGNYVSQFKILINQSPRIEEKIAQAHKTLKGLKPNEVDSSFLKKASSVDTYGYYPYTIKDSKAGQVYMGATPRGILVYQTSRKLHHLKWSDVEGLDYSGKEFYVYPKKAYFEENNLEQEESFQLNGTHNGSRISTGTTSKSPSRLDLHKESKKKPTLKFLCPSSTFAKHMWKYMLGQQAFFTSAKSLDVKPVVKRSLLFRNSTFRWHPSGRVLEELRNVQWQPRLEPTYERLSIPRQQNRDERGGPWANKFHTMPTRVNKTIPEADEANKSLEAPEFGGTAPAGPGVTTRGQQGGGGAQRPGLRDSLLLDTTDRPSPVITPASSLSPQSNQDLTELSSDELAALGKGRTPSGQKLFADGVRTGTDPNAKMKEWSATVWTSSTETVQVKRSPDGVKLLTPSSGSTPTGPFKDTTTIPGFGQQPGASRRALRWFFSLLLLCIAAFVIVVAAMEVSNTSLERLPMMDEFRHRYYEPGRKYVCEKLSVFLK